MASTEVKVPIGNMLDGVYLNVTITGMRAFSVRIWIARWFFWIGALIVGTPVVFDFKYGEGGGGESDTRLR